MVPVQLPGARVLSCSAKLVDSIKVLAHIAIFFLLSCIKKAQAPGVRAQIAVVDLITAATAGRCLETATSEMHHDVGIPVTLIDILWETGRN